MISDSEAARRAEPPHWAERLVLFLDDGIALPGTRYRFGFDALLGLLLPVLGDATTAAGSLPLFWLAIRRGVPKPVLARMALNVAIDTLVGGVPVLGDVFDLVWKSNRRNLNLIRGVLAQTANATSAAPTRTGKLSDYAVIAGIALLIGCALAIPLLVAGWLIEAFRR